MLPRLFACRKTSTAAVVATAHAMRKVCGAIVAADGDFSAFLYAFGFCGLPFAGLVTAIAFLTTAGKNPPRQ